MLAVDKSQATLGQGKRWHTARRRIIIMNVSSYLRFTFLGAKLGGFSSVVVIFYGLEMFFW